MAGDYYSRSSTATSGGPAFATDDDGRNEAAAKAAIEAAMKVELVRYGGRFNPIDWYAMRDGRIVAYLELKTRTHPASAFPTVYLNLRKWNVLQMNWLYTGVPSYFFVAFARDGAGGEGAESCGPPSPDVRCIDVAAIDARNLEVGGCNRRVKSRTDREPVIHVPIADMKIINRRTQG